MPNTVPQTTTLEAFEAKMADAARKSRVNYSFYFGATNTNTPLLKDLDKSRVCGVKLFMGSSTGNMLVDRMDALRTIFSEAGILIAAHCEDQSVIAENIKRCKALYGDDPDVSHHPEIRSAEACYRSSELAVRLARETGARLHIAHISTARELTLLEAAPAGEQTHHSRSLHRTSLFLSRRLCQAGNTHQVQSRHQDISRPRSLALRTDGWQNRHHRHRPCPSFAERQRRRCSESSFGNAHVAIFLGDYAGTGRRRCPEPHRRRRKDVPCSGPSLQHRRPRIHPSGLPSRLGPGAPRLPVASLQRKHPEQMRMESDGRAHLSLGRWSAPLSTDIRCMRKARWTTLAVDKP